MCILVFFVCTEEYIVLLVLYVLPLNFACSIASELLSLPLVNVTTANSLLASYAFVPKMHSPWIREFTK